MKWSRNKYAAVSRAKKELARRISEMDKIMVEPTNSIMNMQNNLVLNTNDYHSKSNQK